MWYNADGNLVNTGYTSSNASSYTGPYAHWHWTHIAAAAADPQKTCVMARGGANAYWYYRGNDSFAQASNQTLYVLATGSNTGAWCGGSLVAAPRRPRWGSAHVRRVSGGQSMGVRGPMHVPLAAWRSPLLRHAGERHRRPEGLAPGTRPVQQHPCQGLSMAPASCVAGPHDSALPACSAAVQRDASFLTAASASWPAAAGLPTSAPPPAPSSARSRWPP
jgi:hypothetical protein